MQYIPFWEYKADELDWGLPQIGVDGFGYSGARLNEGDNGKEDGMLL